MPIEIDAQAEFDSLEDMKKSLKAIFWHSVKESTLTSEPLNVCAESACSAVRGLSAVLQAQAALVDRENVRNVVPRDFIEEEQEAFNKLRSGMVGGATP